ncbi:MAG: acyltransferase [Ottowia sp.]|nr:acyltransferase [Ottowia sp.]
MTLPAASSPPHDTAAEKLSHPKYRPDIDGLRAVAVLAVVIFHASPRRMPGGFAGVDVFFVISGYLISTILLENLARDTFSLATFYMRRIRRIFPALAVVLAASFAFGWLSLFADEFASLGKHMAAGAGFVANLALWHEAGYFDTASELKPLLHLWSLGIEEQFYLVWPLLLWLAWKRKFNVLTVIALLLVASFVVNVFFIGRDATATFYAPYTRFWELLAGSLLAWWHLRPTSSEKHHSNTLSIAGFVLLALGFWKITKATPFPGAWAAVPVAGAFLVIAAGQRAWLNRVVLGNRVAVFFGLISFPLYLWHWPLLAFARIIDGGKPASAVRVAAVLTAIVLAWLTWRFIERPLRFGGHGKAKAIALAVVVAVLGSVGYLTWRVGGFPARAANQSYLPYHFGWGNDPQDGFCRQRFFSDGFQAEFCRLTPNQPDPAIVLIGDSMAYHFFHGLNQRAQQHGVGVLALEQGECAALLGFIWQRRQLANGDLDANMCAQVTNKALELALNNPSVKTVIFAHHPALWPDSETRFLHDPSPGHGDAAYTRLIQDNLRRTFSALLAQGKHIVYVVNNSRFSFHPKSCIARRFLPPLKAVCAEPREDWLTDGDARLRAAIDGVLAEFPQVRRFDLASAICDEERCWAMKDGKLLYRDGSHLTSDGSDLVAEKLWQEMVTR